MTTASRTWTEETIEVAGTRLQLVKGGTGDPLLVLHDEMGHSGWLRAYEELARNRTVYIPSHPGFGGSQRLDWVMTIRDLAGWYRGALNEIVPGPVDVVGLSLGGWLAAEMAAMCPHLFKKLVVVSAPGIRPPEGEIFDMFLVTAQPYIEAGFLHPDELPEYGELFGGDPTPEVKETREVAREQSCRLTWRPYMHNLALPHLLRNVTLPTLIVWGKQDAIVPVSAAHAYHEAISGSRLELLDDCGHHPEIEQSEKFVQLVRDFL